jgi:hypothetical protein
VDRQLVRARVAIALSLLALAACLGAVGFSAAVFTDSSQNPQTVSAVADFLAPSAGASAIAETQGGVAGQVKPGGAYYAYAGVTDSGNPASGIASVKADLREITAGQTAVALSAGSYSFGGVSYNYRSSQLSADAGLKSGSRTYALALTDSAGNARTQSFSVTVEGEPFAGSAFATENVSRGTEGKPEEGDSVIFTFNRPPNPSSIASKWSGAKALSVTVSVSDESSLDTLTVSGASIGEVNFEGNYVANKKTAVFTKSSMSLSGSVVTIVLGENSSNAKKDTNKNPSAWTPVASILDLAGNACSTAAVTGANERQF